MTDEEKQLMNKFETTYEAKTIFYYSGYRYERMNNTINYAKKMVSTNLKP